MSGMFTSLTGAVGGAAGIDGQLISTIGTGMTTSWTQGADDVD